MLIANAPIKSPIPKATTLEAPATKALIQNEEKSPGTQRLAVLLSPDINPIVRPKIDLPVRVRQPERFRSNISDIYLF